MNAQSRIRSDDLAVCDVDLTAIMEREGIHKIQRFVAGRISVVLDNGSIGVGGSVREALHNAKRQAA